MDTLGNTTRVHTQLCLRVGRKKIPTAVGKGMTGKRTGREESLVTNTWSKTMVHVEQEVVQWDVGQKIMPSAVEHARRARGEVIL